MGRLNNKKKMRVDEPTIPNKTNQHIAKTNHADLVFKQKLKKLLTEVKVHPDQASQKRLNVNEPISNLCKPAKTSVGRTKKSAALILESRIQPKPGNTQQSNGVASNLTSNGAGHSKAGKRKKVKRPKPDATLTTRLSQKKESIAAISKPKIKKRARGRTENTPGKFVRAPNKRVDEFLHTPGKFVRAPVDEESNGKAKASNDQAKLPAKSTVKEAKHISKPKTKKRKKLRTENTPGKYVRAPNTKLNKFTHTPGKFVRAPVDHESSANETSTSMSGTDTDDNDDEDDLGQEYRNDTLAKYVESYDSCSESYNDSNTNTDSDNGGYHYSPYDAMLSENDDSDSTYEPELASSSEEFESILDSSSDNFMDQSLLIKCKDDVLVHQGTASVLPASVVTNFEEMFDSDNEKSHIFEISIVNPPLSPTATESNCSDNEKDSRPTAEVTSSTDDEVVVDDADDDGNGDAGSDSDTSSVSDHMSHGVEKDEFEDEIEDALVGPVDGTTIVNGLNFFNALLVLKERLYFYGALQVTLLVGEASIFGHQLKKNVTVDVYAPRGHCAYYIETCPVGNAPEISSTHVSDMLNVHSNNFLKSDLAAIERTFNASEQSIILLERTNSLQVAVINDYMEQPLFPNVQRKSGNRPFKQTESILHAQFMINPPCGLQMSAEWATIPVDNGSKTIVVGGKSVGKSNLIRYLVNKHIDTHGKMLLIDLDIGQPESFVPQTVSATILQRPLLGPGFMYNILPEKAIYFGDICCTYSPIKYIQCVIELIAYCNSVERLRNMVWIVNTMGFTKGIALELLATIVRVVVPTTVVEIRSPWESKNFDTSSISYEYVRDLSFKIFSDDIAHLAACEQFKTITLTSLSGVHETKQSKWILGPKECRTMRLIAWLAPILNQRMHLNEITPNCAPLSSIEILSSEEDDIDPADLSDIANGNLVYMCKADNANTTPSVHIECLGIGIVRSFDIQNDRLFLLNTLAADRLCSVKVLIVSKIPLPSDIALLQNRNAADGSIPYVYSSVKFELAKEMPTVTLRPQMIARQKLQKNGIL